MNCNLTLNFIRETWCSGTRKMDRQFFCRQILPDAYDPELCRDQGGHFFNPEDDRRLSEQTLNGLMRGNRKSGRDLNFASVAFTKDFQNKLAHNSPIEYLDPNRAQEITVENMLGKLRRMIRLNCAPMDRGHMLFTHMDFSTLGEGPEQTDFDQMQLAIAMLLERGTEDSLTYALFLMIVTAILQSRIAAVKHLYSLDVIEKILASDKEAPVLEIENHYHVPFTDPNYMHTYNIYFYKDTPGRKIWSGKLTMQLQNNRPVATITLASQSRSPVSGEVEINRVFRGVPMLSKRENVVYMGLADERNTFAFLTFAYMPFQFAPMYFRSGLLVSTAPETKFPIAQRVAIVARDLKEEELPYVRGLLKTGGKQMLMTQQQYDLFLEAFREYPWMADFLTHYAPQFEAHKKTVYCFNEDELLAWSIGDLSQEDRLRILLALRSVDQPSNSMLEKFLESVPPTRTHAILK